MNWPASISDALAITMSQLRVDPDTGLLPEQRLKTLARSLVLLARELETVIETEVRLPERETAPKMTDPAAPPPSYDETAERVYRSRRRRAEIFADDTLFGEPAWDILLDLFVAGERGKRVAVTSACIGSGVPSTTALRWLNVLEMRGLVEREDDNQDARRSFVRLTIKAKHLMREYFSTSHG